MNKKILIILAMIGVLIVGCKSGKTNTIEKVEENKIIEAAKEEVEEESKENRIVSLSPPIFSMLALKGVQDDVVGLTPVTFKSANEKVIEVICPNKDKINVDFIGQDFKVNIESLLNLDPSLILYYGKFQGEDLDKTNVPNYKLRGDTMDPEELTLYWEEQLSEILNMENEKKMEKAWQKSKDIIGENHQETKMKGLYLFSNVKEIQVSGSNSYGDAFMKMAGIDNVASDIEGFKEGAGQAVVSMEQIHEWNPDIIFIASGSSAQDIIENKIPNQNWDNINAIKEKKVFNIPVGSYNWGMPCADSSLLPVWMVHCLNPEVIEKDYIRDLVKEHYIETYQVEIDDEIIDSILER